MKPDPCESLPLDLWLLETAELTDSETRKELLQWLSEDELLRYRRFHFDRDRDSFLQCRAFLREVLASYLSCSPETITFVTNQWGKPSIQAPAPAALSFNISHTDGLAVLAVSKQVRLGVDVEDSERLHEGAAVARRFFADAECEQLAVEEHGSNSMFFAFWTLKEAYIKAVGKGLAIPLKSFAFQLAGSGIGVTFDETLEDDAAQWRFLRLSYGERYPIALALDSTRPLTLNSRIGRPAVSQSVVLSWLAGSG